jgi:hypothetical protein
MMLSCEKVINHEMEFRMSHYAIIYKPLNSIEAKFNSINQVMERNSELLWKLSRDVMEGFENEARMLAGWAQFIESKSRDIGKASNCLSNSVRILYDSEKNAHDLFSVFYGTIGSSGNPGETPDGGNPGTGSPGDGNPGDGSSDSGTQDTDNSEDGVPGDGNSSGETPDSETPEDGTPGDGNSNGETPGGSSQSGGSGSDATDAETGAAASIIGGGAASGAILGGGAAVGASAGSGATTVTDTDEDEEGMLKSDDDIEETDIEDHHIEEEEQIVGDDQNTVSGGTAAISGADSSGAGGSRTRIDKTPGRPGIAVPIIGAASAGSMAASGVALSQRNKVKKVKVREAGEKKFETPIISALMSGGNFIGNLNSNYVLLTSALSLTYVGVSFAAASRKNKSESNDRFKIGYGVSAVLNNGEIQVR